MLPAGHIKSLQEEPIMLYAIVEVIGRIVTFFEPNAIDDFARMLAWIGALF